MSLVTRQGKGSRLTIQEMDANLLYLENLTGSLEDRLDILETESGSIRIDFNSYTGSTDSRVGSLETESGSIRTDFNNFTGSYNTGSFLSQTDFLPSETDVYDLGSSSKRWRDLYLSGSSIFLGDVIITEEAGELTIKDSLGDNVPLQGTAASASYVEFSDVGNKPTLVSGSSQITLSDTDGFTSYSGSVETLITNLETESGSVRTDFNSYTSSADGRIGSLETESGSVRTDFNSYTSSADGRFGSLETESGSIRIDFNSYTGSTDVRVGSLETESGSIRTDLNTQVSTFNSYTSSADGRFGSLETESGSIRTDLNTQVSTFNSYTSSADTRFGSLETESGSIRTDFNSYTSSVDTTLNNLETESGSIRTDFNSYTSSADNRFDSLETESGSVRTDLTTQVSTFNSYTSSTDIRVNSLETESGSIRTDLNTQVSTFNSYTSSVNTTLNNLETESGSIRTDFNSYTSSADGRLGSLESYSSSLNTALSLDGSNVTILGNLEVSGTTTIIDSTTVQIGDNIIELNAAGAVNGGLLIRDVTAPNTISGSLLWNTTTDKWIAGQLGSEYNILLAIGDDVVSGSSQISFSGITDKPTLVSGSSQINHDSTTGFISNEHIDHSAVSISAGLGLSGGGTIVSTRTLTLDTGSAHFTNGVKTKLNTDGVISGSSQVAINSTTGTLDVNKGGTGQTSYINGQLLIGNTTGNTLTKATLTQGTGITITNGTGTITVTNSSPNATHTGDVTGATALTIANNAVTNAKAADMAVSTIKGRVTAGTGDPEDLTASQVRTLINVADGATANSTNATLLARANHTGTQLASTISDFQATVSANSNVTANTAKVTNATHTGDVTGATALTIANNAVTNAKAADMAVSTIKGRVTAGTGDPEDLTASQVRTLINVADGAQVNVATNLSWTAGTTAGPQVNSSTGTDAVIPSASGTASGVVTTGTQTFAGAKTFSSTLTAGKLVPTANTVTGNGMYLPTTNTLAFSTNGGERLRITPAGGMGLGVTPTDTSGRFEASNDVVAFSSSDKRWKTKINIIQNPLEKINKINGVEFDWIEDEPVHGNKGHDIGIIAQEVESVFPEIVQIRDSGMKAVRYEKLIPLLIEAIKEQQRQIDYLTSKIK